jgi:CDP-paratose 2-epimerase
MFMPATNSGGLIGYEAVSHFASLADRNLDTDNNMPCDFFGSQGDTTWNVRRLES